MNHDSIRTLTAPSLTLLTLLALAWLPACTDDTSDAGDETETGGDEPLAIIGDYMDNFGDAHSITQTEWQNGAGSFAISSYDNAAMYLIAQNASTNQFSPDLWSRFDWTFSADDLYYCQSVYDGATPEDAEAGSANADDLAMGCNGFSWSLMTPQ